MVQYGNIGLKVMEAYDDIHCCEQNFVEAWHTSLYGEYIIAKYHICNKAIHYIDAVYCSENTRSAPLAKATKATLST